MQEHLLLISAGITPAAIAVGDIYVSPGDGRRYTITRKEWLDTVGTPTSPAGAASAYGVTSVWRVEFWGTLA